MGDCDDFASAIVIHHIKVEFIGDSSVYFRGESGFDQFALSPIHAQHVCAFTSPFPPIAQHRFHRHKRYPTLLQPFLGMTTQRVMHFLFNALILVHSDISLLCSF